METFRDIILRVALKIKDNKLPAADTKLAEKAIGDYMKTVEDSSKKLARTVAGHTSATVTAAAREVSTLGRHWDQVNEKVKAYAGLNRVQQRDVMATVDQNARWAGILRDVNREYERSIALAASAGRDPNDPKWNALWQDYRRARGELEQLDLSLVETTRLLGLFDGEFKRADKAGGGFNVEHLLQQPRAVQAARQAGQANLARSIASERELAAARAASLVTMREESLAARVWVSRLKEMEMAEVAAAAAASKRSLGSRAKGGFAAMRGTGFLAAGLIGSLAPDPQLSDAALKTGEAAREAQKLSDRFSSAADSITLFAAGAAIINPALAPVGLTVAVIAQGAKFIANSGMVREFTGINKAAEEGEKIEKRRLVIVKQLIAEREREEKILKGQISIQERILDRERKHRESLPGRRVDDVGLFDGDPTRKAKAIEAAHQKLVGELSGIGRERTLIDHHQNELTGVDLLDPKNKVFADRAKSLLRREEELAGEEVARRQALQDLAGERRGNRGEIADKSLGLLERLRSRFEEEQSGSPLDRHRKQKDRGYNREGDELFGELAGLGYKRTAVDSGEEIQAIIDRIKQEQKAAAETDVVQVQKSREFLDEAKRKQAELGDAIDEFALDMIGVVDTTLNKMDQHQAEIRKLRDQHRETVQAVQAIRRPRL